MGFSGRKKTRTWRVVEFMISGIIER